MITLNTRLILTPELISRVNLYYSPSITLGFPELSLIKSMDTVATIEDTSSSDPQYYVEGSTSTVNYILIYSTLSGKDTLTAFAVLSQPLDMSIVQKTTIHFSLRDLTISLIQDTVNIGSEFSEHASPSDNVINHKYVFQDSTTSRITYTSDKLNSKIKAYPAYRQANRLEIKTDYALVNLDHKAVTVEKYLSSNNVNSDDYFLPVEYYQNLDAVLALLLPNIPVRNADELISDFTGVTSNPIDGILIYTYVEMQEDNKRYLILSGGGNNKEIHIYDVDLDLDAKTVLGLPQIFTYYDTIITSGKLCSEELYAFRSSSSTVLGTVNDVEVRLFTTARETIISSLNKYYLPDFFDFAYIFYELEGTSLYYQPFDHPRMSIADSNYLPSAFLPDYFGNVSLSTHRNVVNNYLLASLTLMREVIDNDQDTSTVRLYDTFLARADQDIIKIYPYSHLNTALLNRYEISTVGVEEICCNGQYVVIKYSDLTVKELNLITGELSDAIVDETSSWYWYRGCKFKITTTSVVAKSDNFGDVLIYDYEHPSYSLGYS